MFPLSHPTLCSTSAFSLLRLLALGGFHAGPIPCPTVTVVKVRAAHHHSLLVVCGCSDLLKLTFAQNGGEVMCFYLSGGGSGARKVGPTLTCGLSEDPKCGEKTLGEPPKAGLPKLASNFEESCESQEITRGLRRKDLPSVVCTIRQGFPVPGPQTNHLWPPIACITT